MSKTEFVNHHRLKGLDLARYILQKLKHDKNFYINSVSKEFDNDEHFVKSILTFLRGRMDIRRSKWNI